MLPWPLMGCVALLFLFILVGLRRRAAVLVILEPVHTASADVWARLSTAVLHSAFRPLDDALRNIALVHRGEVIVDLAFGVVWHASSSGMLRLRRVSTRPLLPIARSCGSTI